MLPELLEIINHFGANIHLYKTCKSFYLHKSIFYKNYIIDMNTNNKYHLVNHVIKYNIFRYDIDQSIIDYMIENSYQIINFSNHRIFFKNLTHLTMDHNFDQPIILSATLIHLTLGYCFNQPIALPNTLKHLTMGSCFD